MQLKDVEEERMEVELLGKKDKQNRLRGHKLSLTCVCIDSQGGNAFTGSKDGSIIKWCLNTRKILNKVNSLRQIGVDSDKDKKSHVKYINCIAISSDDKFLATGGWDKHIRIWSPSDMTWIHTFTLHRQEITALVFRQDHSTLYSGSADRSVMLWTLEEDDNRCFIEALYGHESTITSIDALRRERVLTSGGRDQSLRLWKIIEQAQTVFLTKHESADIAKFIDDKTFVSGGEDGAITVWTTLKRSPVLSHPNAHGSNQDMTSQSSGNSAQPSLKYWIISLAVFPLTSAKQSKSTKRQKLDGNNDEAVTRYDDDNDDNDDEDDEDDEENDEGEDELGSNDDNALAFIASGSCDSKLNIWTLSKSSGKFKLKLHQSHECPGFINDLRFTIDGSKIVAACGQEHRFGRWWKLSGASKNSMRVFDIKKYQ